MDFGNREKLNSERVRTIDAALAAVPAQARPACLAYLKVGVGSLLASCMGQICFAISRRRGSSLPCLWLLPAATSIPL